MSIRSDVGVALKKSVDVSKFPENVQTLLNDHADETVQKEEGTLYVFTSVKTQADDMQALFKALRETVEDEDYLVVEACHDYPDSDGENAGCWDENPFNVHKNVEVSIYWEDLTVGD